MRLASPPPAPMPGLLSATQVAWRGELRYHPTAPSTVYLLSDGGFHRSTNGGQSWQLTLEFNSNDGAELTVDPFNGDRLFLVVARRLLVSTDRGATFAATPSLPPEWWTAPIRSQR